MNPVLNKAIKVYVPRVNRWLDKLLPEESETPEAVHRAMRYSVFSGGKRLRPILAIEAFKWANGKGQAIYPSACALEMIHAYSLIHDDLPAMDNDDFRRGKPTCHRVFGEAMAILAGDALHALAFEILSKTKNNDIVREVAIAIGTDGLVGGQVVDIELEGCDISESDVRFIHERKTAALFVTAVRTGAMIAKAPKNKLNALTKYAKKLGLAFQITDDILDIKGDSKKLGKSIGSDLKLDKATYPKAIGLDASQKKAEQLIKSAKRDLSSGNDNSVLNAIADFVLSRAS